RSRAARRKKERMYGQRGRAPRPNDVSSPLEIILMIACCRNSGLWAPLATLSLATTAIRADTFTGLAFNNATVQPAGPRKFSSGKNFFNIEGANNLPNFASWGAADFNLGAILLDVNGNPLANPPT